MVIVLHTHHCHAKNLPQKDHWTHNLAFLAVAMRAKWYSIPVNETPAAWARTPVLKEVLKENLELLPPDYKQIQKSGMLSCSSFQNWPVGSDHNCAKQVRRGAM